MVREFAGERAKPRVYEGKISWRGNGEGVPRKGPSQLIPCGGCSLSNVTKKRCSDLVYSFPIDAPMRVLFVDIYAAGAEQNFSGTTYYLIEACGMTAFAICEDTPEQNSTTYVCCRTDEDMVTFWIFTHNCS